MSRSWRLRGVGFTLVAGALAFAACGGGGGGDDARAAETLATRLLGAEATDSTSEEHECIAEAISAALDDDTLDTLAAAPSLDDLDLPTRELLLTAALECVDSTDLN